MAQEVVIPVGKGRIIIHPSLRDVAASGNYIIIEAKTEKGPCNDVDCQPIYRSEARIGQVPDDSHRIFLGEGYMIAIDQAVYNAIDRNRDEVTIKKSLKGKISIHGLTL